MFSLVIDNGSRYFSEDDTINKIKIYFEIVGIGYLHTKGAIKFEQFLIRFISYYNVLKNIDEYKTKSYYYSFKTNVIRFLSNKFIF